MLLNISHGVRKNKAALSISALDLDRVSLHNEQEERGNAFKEVRIAPFLYALPEMAFSARGRATKKLIET